MTSYRPVFSISYFIGLFRFLLPVLILFYFLESNDWYWYIIGIIAINIGILLIAFWRTSYTIDEDKQTLIVQSFIFRRIIPIPEIKSIKNHISNENAPAFTKDRILIIWKGGSIQIAPIQRAELTAQLKHINSAIQLFKRPS